MAHTLKAEGGLQWEIFSRYVPNLIKEESWRRRIHKWAVPIQPCLSIGPPCLLHARHTELWRLRGSPGSWYKFNEIIFLQLPLLHNLLGTSQLWGPPFLIFWLESWGFELATPLCNFYCVLPGQVVRGLRGRRKSVKIPPRLLAQSFRHLLYWHCHHYCYWHSYYATAATMGLPLGWRSRSYKNKTSDNNNNNTFTNSFCPLGAQFSAP